MSPCSNSVTASSCGEETRCLATRVWVLDRSCDGGILRTLLSFIDRASADKRALDHGKIISNLPVKICPRRGFDGGAPDDGRPDQSSAIGAAALEQRRWPRRSLAIASRRADRRRNRQGACQGARRRSRRDRKR